MSMLVSGAPDLGGVVAAVTAEFAQASRVRRMLPEERRRLLQVLHATRALDTTLSEVVRVRANPVVHQPHSLGQYLDVLAGPGTRSGTLPHQDRVLYKRTIADVRNRFMHEADSYPESHELAALLGQMTACLAKVLRL